MPISENQAMTEMNPLAPRAHVAHGHPALERRKHTG
jgi:hypothetical protein